MTYIKARKTVVVDAVRFEGRQNAIQAKAFAETGKNIVWANIDSMGDLQIRTHEGMQEAFPGYYIIREGDRIGVCSPENFKEHYEVIEKRGRWE